MKEIAGVPIAEFLEVAEEVLAKFLQLPGNPDPKKTGCYLALMQKAKPGIGISEKMILIVELGTCSLTKAPTYFEFCQEKVRRLHSIWAHEGDHISSYQSRDPSKDKWGGGIAVPPDSFGTKEGKEMIGAISGLGGIDLGDEAVITVIFMIFRWITLDDAKIIVTISDNPFFRPLLNACGDLFDRPITAKDREEAKQRA